MDNLQLTQMGIKGPLQLQMMGCRHGLQKVLTQLVIEMALTRLGLGLGL